MANFTYITKESTNIAKSAINECISRYIKYINDIGMSKETSKKYKSMIKQVVGDFNIPISQITDKQINEYITELHYEKKWSDRYTSTLVGIITKFFIWCKDNNYTLIDFKIKNPNNGNVVVTKTDVTPKEPFISVKKSNNELKPAINILSNKSDDITDTIISIRNTAIKNILNYTNITIYELAELTIYDFIHNKIIIQSFNNRNNMRIVNIDIKTRNSIYKYLITRTDSNEGLFLSNTINGNSITLPELRQIISD